MIKSVELKNLLLKLIKLQKEEHEWIESLNDEIRSVFYENTYVNKILLEHDHILKFALGALYEDVYWFLYEWKPGYNIQSGDINYVINDFADYMRYLETEGLVEV
jgi:hypothetical protein